MGELGDRRARKKAQTRLHIRQVAQDLFATHGFDPVTIADVAEAADVAVQTVFNHFATKEELFFADRMAFLDGPAEAVRSRDPQVSALDALREHLVSTAGEIAAWQVTAEGRAVLASIERSPSLKTYERELVHETERRLSEALAETWAQEPEPGGTGAVLPADSGTTAPLIAAIWVAAFRVLVLDQRRVRAESADPAGAAAAVQTLAGTLLDGIQSQLAPRGGRSPSRRLRAG